MYVCAILCQEDLNHLEVGAPPKKAAALIPDKPSKIATVLSSLAVLCIIHDRQIYTPRTAFSVFKEKTALGGIRTHDTLHSR